MVSLMTALWFAHLEAPDRVSVKPHASPVLHAINFLLGRLDPAYLPRLREYGGLQSYPSRTKDPDPVDYSTGSVGIGATATIWGALAHRYVAGHFDVPARRAPDRAAGRRRARRGRRVGGDRRPDGGAPRRGALGRRPQPPVAGPRRARHRRRAPRGDVRGGRLAHRDRQVRAAPARALRARRGRRPARADRRDGQRGVPAPAARRRRAAARSPARPATRRSTGSSPSSTRAGCWPPSATSAATTSRACSPPTARPMQSATARPSSSPTRSRAGRCPPRATPPTTRRCSTTSSSSTSPSSWAPTRASRGAPFDADSAEGRLCAAAAARLEREPVESHEPPPVPVELGRGHSGTGSTQQALGRLFVDLDHDAPEVSAPRRHRRAGRRVVDQPRRLDQPQRHLEHRRAHRLVRRRLRHARALARVRSRAPRRARHRRGQPRRPARRARGDVEPRRDARCCRWARSTTRSSCARTSRGRSASTPAGSRSSSARRRGSRWDPRAARTSRSSRRRSGSSSRAAWRGSRPSPRTSSGRSCTRSARWAARTAARPTSACRRGRSTRGSPQVPPEGAEREQRRADVLAGGYRLREGERVTIVAVGAVVPEALEAAAVLDAEVVCLTSPDLVFRALQARAGLAAADHAILERLFPAPRPLVTVVDGHPTPSPSSPACTGRRSRAWAWRSSASRATSPTSTAITASTPRRSSARRSTCPDGRAGLHAPGERRAPPAAARARRAAVHRARLRRDLDGADRPRGRDLQGPALPLLPLQAGLLHGHARGRRRGRCARGSSRTPRCPRRRR